MWVAGMSPVGYAFRWLDFKRFPFFSSRKDRLSTVSGFGFGWFLFFWEDGWLDTLSLVLCSKCNAPQSKLSVVLWEVGEKLPPKGQRRLALDQ